MFLSKDQMFFIDRRNHPRYLVGNIKELILKMESLTDQTQTLHSLSQGGCGFYGSGPPHQSFYRMNPGCRALLCFEWKGITTSPIKIIGTYNYKTKVVSEGREDTWYYGVEFMKEYAFLILPIVDRLEQLRQQKIVKLG
jgi:hypothetical protein